MIEWWTLISVFLMRLLIELLNLVQIGRRKSSSMVNWPECLSESLPSMFRLLTSLLGLRRRQPMSRSKLLSSKFSTWIPYIWPLTTVFLLTQFPLCWMLKPREESEGNLKGILGYIEDDVVSTDFIGDSR